MKTKEKFGKILYVGLANKYYSAYHHCYLVLEKLADKLITYDYRQVNLKYGKEEMNRRFLELIEKEKPDFIFVYSIVDDFYIETLLKIREVSPNSLTMMFFGDDDSMYESYSRYYKLFFDYCIVYQEQYLYRYKEEGSKNTFVSLGINIDNFKPMNLKKKYDVIFYGIPEFDRYNYIKFLIENSINVRIFGRGWHIYPEFEKNYGGVLSNEDFVKTINESKIVINFSKNLFGVPHYKGRYFEAAACKSFILVEYFDVFAKKFKQEKDKITFKDKEDLLKKVRYYLDHPKEREEIAERVYKKVIKEFNFYNEMKTFFKMHYKKKPVHLPLQKVNKKIIEINKSDIHLPIEKLKNKLKGFGYVCFNNNIVKKDKYKEYLQTYALEKSGRDISCSACYVSNKNIGTYLYYNPYDLFHKNKEHFKEILDINLLAVKKEYLIKNIEIFKKLFENKKMDFMTKENTIFIQLPIVEIQKLNYVNYKDMKSYIIPKFLYKLYSLKYHNKLFSEPYVYKLLLEILKGNYFLFWLINGARNDPYYKNKINELNGQQT